MTMTRMTRRVMTWNTTGKLKKFRVNLQDAEKNLEVSPAHGKLLSSSELQQQKNSC